MFTTEELRAYAIPRPSSYGVIHMHCEGCRVPSVEIRKRDDDGYVLILNGDVFVYVQDEQQLMQLDAEIDTKMRAVLGEE